MDKRMAGSSSPVAPAEPEALKHSFSYLVNSIDTAALLPAALSRNLITNRQRTECYNEADPYKQAETFLGYLQRAVSADYDNFHTFVQILKETDQAKIASRLRDELAHSFRSMQQPSASNSTDEGLERVVVPDALVKELATLRFGFAKLLRSYEKQLRNSPEAQEEFVEFLPRLFPDVISSSEHSSFQSAFNKFVEEEVSLFNTHYLKRICNIFPKDICAATETLVDEYEQQLDRFMASATVSQFKQLFPATATPSKLLAEKVAVKLKLKNKWGSKTLQDLTELVINFGVSGSAFHLSKVEDGCIAVTWLCSTTEAKQLKMAILEAAGSLQTMGVLQVFIGEEKLVLEYTHSATAVKQLDGLSDLPQSSAVQQSELMTVMTPFPATPPTESLVHLVHKTDIDYQCPICLEPLTQPFLTDCGHHLCDICLFKSRNLAKNECPTCRKSDMLNDARRDKYLQRKVNSLKVRCSDYKEGCEWVGELRDLHDHFDPAKGGCGIACPFGCGKYGCKSKMREHSLRHCHKRMISCKNCDYYNTFTIVTEKHYPICPVTVSPQYRYNQAPMEFIISSYREKKESDEVWYGSPFYTHNRGYKFRLEVYPNGYDTGNGSHLSVAAALMSGEYDNKLKWPFEGDIRVELLNWRADMYHHSYTIDFHRYIDPDHKSTYRITDQEIETAPGLGNHQFISHTDLVSTTNTEYLRDDYLKLRVSAVVYSTPLHPLVAPAWQKPLSTTHFGAQFTISEYSKRKQFNNYYCGPSFTTGPQGYRFCLRVNANGYGSGEGSHLSIYAYIMKGQYDDRLQWPFTGTIIIELLNWLEDKGHYKVTLPIDNFFRVTDGEYGKSRGYEQFISQSYLNSSTNTCQYLYQDCIRVRVQAIA